MIRLDLPADREEALRRQALALGFSTSAYLEYLVDQHVAALQPQPVDDQTRSLRAAAIERILQARNGPDAPTLDLPAGMSLREYIHEGHRY